MKQQICILLSFHISSYFFVAGGGGEGNGRQYFTKWLPILMWQLWYITVYQFLIDLSLILAQWLITTVHTKFVHRQFGGKIIFMYVSIYLVTRPVIFIFSEKSGLLHMYNLQIFVFFIVMVIFTQSYVK